MTPTDLRVQFKLETGHYPFWDIQSYNPRPFVGKFKSLYGLWLEERLGNSKKLRETYYEEESINPIYPSEKGYNHEALNSKYTLWLEEKCIG